MTSAVNISGGATTGSGGIDMSTAANGTVNSTLTVSGGTLSVGTGGISAPNGIYRTAATNTTATVIINGGSLDLNGNAIGGSGANAITTQFESGTLSNVSQINGGAGLTKTTGGTLALATANTFTGNTLVSAGTLALDNNLALQRSALDTDGAGVVTLGSLITTPTLGGLTGAKNLASSITTGYSSVTNLTLNPQSGTVTYSGNITNGATGMTLTKSGAGTQVLSGLSTTASNNYTGTTILDGGTLSLTQ
ncbi:autotransporter-associated beta strand repeat-containing protein, partial [bacterium]|nr:autotransporter-associated beta strand repeat-containing protein [bacterium]